MRIEYGDDDLRRMATDRTFRLRQFGPNVLRAYRKKIQILDAAVDERDLQALHSLSLKKLKGNRAGTYSIRLNEQFRLILAFHTDADARVVVVIELIDYH